MSTASCPFCGGEVEEQLVLYGGPCPRCFAEIPGEEAATDPGEEVKQAEEAKDVARARRRAVVPLLLAVPVAFALAAGAVLMLLWPDPELELLDFDDGEYYMPDLDMLVAAAEEKEAEPEVYKRPKKRNSGSHISNDVGSASGGPKTVDVGGDRAPSWMQGSSGYKPNISGPDVELTLGGTPDKVLTDPKQIRDMVARVLRAEIPKLNSCYERRLKVDPSFGGQWQLTLIVQPDGSVKSPSARGMELRDGEFEQCVVAKLERWRFQPIKGNQPVKKTVTFRS